MINLEKKIFIKIYLSLYIFFSISIYSLYLYTGDLFLPCSKEVNNDLKIETYKNNNKKNNKKKKINQII